MLHILVLLFCINYTTIVEMSRNEHFLECIYYGYMQQVWDGIKKFIFWW